MTEPTTGGRLLLVDDDLLLRAMACKTLRHAGFDVTEASDGEQALEMFTEGLFDLLLLDVMMPGMDGYEVCRRVRALPQGARLPILMLTGLNDTESIELAYRAGATDFLTKPINWSLLSHRVRYSLRAGAAVEAALRMSESLSRAQRMAHMGSWEIGLAGDQLTCSAELMRMMGGPAEQPSCHSQDDFLLRVCDADRMRVKNAREAARREGTPYQITFDVERFDGEVRTVYEQGAPVFDGSGRQIAVEGITQDISDRVEAERRIRLLADYDSLTGLPNRKFMGDLAERVVQRAQRLGSACALLHVDLDRFKSVNDAFGRGEGDVVLHTMAERIQAATRATAGGSTEAVVARVGANAFTVLLADAGNERQVAAVADRLLRAIAEPVVARGYELVLTGSIGIAMFPRDARTVAALARCAEQALYAARAAGRARQRFFDETINAQASARLARETDLRRAILEGQLRLHYQPKVDARDGAITGAEALVRWQHPERGLVPPGEFIPLAEESTLIGPLTDWVLEQACADLRRFADAGLPARPISVNLSSTSFASDALPGSLDDLLARHRLEASSLVLEVTESLLMTDVERAVERLRALRARGFGLSLDDFGTGYSSLSYLKRFPIDELKIDRSFVADVARDAHGGSLAASIIALGREFGLRVVAEGVETAEQSAFLLGHGCTNQQGFLFARPRPADEYAALLAGGFVAGADRAGAARAA